MNVGWNDHGGNQVTYYKTLNICGVKFSWFNEIDTLAYFNVGVHDLPWLMIVKKI